VGDICSQFAADVARSFNFLFVQEAFRVEFHQSGGLDRCMLILGSDKFRIKLYRTVDEVNLQVGSSSAPFTWEEKANGETMWYFLRSIVGFLKKESNPVLSDPTAWASRTYEVQMQELAALLHTHYPQVEELFGEGGFDTVRQDYQRYLENVRDAVMKQYARNAKDPRLTLVCNYLARMLHPRCRDACRLFSRRVEQISQETFRAHTSRYFASSAPR